MADRLALEQYELFNTHRLQREAEADALADDAALELFEEMRKKLPKETEDGR